MILILSLISLITLFIIYRVTRSTKIRVYYNQKGRVAKYVNKMKSLQIPYRPTPWLFNRHLHTLYAMKLRPKPSMESERENVQYPDGGVAIIDWFHPLNEDKDAPVVVIFHTLGGGSRETVVRCFANACVNHGFRAVVANCRGCGGAKYTTERSYNALEVDDFKYIIDNNVRSRNPRNIFICGFSMGGIHACTYCNLYDDVSAVASISNTMNCPVSIRMLEQFPLNKLYLPSIMASHHHNLKKNSFVNCPEALRAKTMTELDSCYTIKTLGLSTIDEYYSQLSIYLRINTFKVPTMCINAIDDPFTKSEFYPTVMAQESQNLVLVTTEEGGHAGFIQGPYGNESLLDNVIIEWFDACANTK